MSSFAAPAASSLKSLDDRRKALEDEAAGITAELNAGPKPMGVSTPLTDSEGFPRNDVDVYRARQLRNRLAVLQTDHKALMKKIEASLSNLSCGPGDGDDQVSDEVRMRLARKPRPKYDNVTGKWVVKNWDGSVAGIEGGDNIMFDDIGDPRADRLRMGNNNNDDNNNNK